MEQVNFRLKKATQIEMIRIVTPDSDENNIISAVSTQNVNFDSNHRR